MSREKNVGWSRVIAWTSVMFAEIALKKERHEPGTRNVDYQTYPPTVSRLSVSETLKVPVIDDSELLTLILPAWSD